MHLRTVFHSLNILLCATVLSASLGAQTDRTITIRMIDGRTGKLITASNFLVRIDHDPTIHANWVAQNEDGSGKLTLPRTATLLSIQGTFDSATQIYLNCDAARDKDKIGDHWYDLPTIWDTGVTAPNGCVKPRVATKLKIAAKPGEFIFYVRKRNVFAQAEEDLADR
jgi:hypothetical protein